MSTETQVNAEQARHLLAGCKRCGECGGHGCARCRETGWIGKPWGRTRMSALKNQMGLSEVRYFFLSSALEYLRAHPDFSESQVYKKKPMVSASATGIKFLVAKIKC